MKTPGIHSHFSIGRMYQLIRNRFMDDIVPVGIIAATIFGLNLASMIFFKFPFYNAISPESNPWGATLFLGGVLLAGTAFSRMHDGRSGPDWILLPASNEEKYLSTVLNYLVLYPLWATGLAVLLSGILYLLSQLFGIDGGAVWTPLQHEPVESMLSYLITTIFALAGSARFRKFALGKTAAVVVAVIILSTLLLMFMILIYYDEGRGILFEYGTGSASDLEIHFGPGSEKYRWMMIIGKFLYWISALFAFLYGYFLVREKESRDEVQ